jgi:dienelactone hydrolase
MKALLAALLLVLVVAGCGGGDDETTTSSSSGSRDGTATAVERAFYKYDEKAPVGVRDAGVINTNYPIKFHDITYISPHGGYVPAYLLKPPGKGPYPGVILLHGSGGSRSDLLQIAGWLAGRGAVTMTIDSAYTRQGNQPLQPGIPGFKADRQLAVQTVADLRRAVDVLQHDPQVDKNKIGFLGFSAGAKSGAVLVGVEPRIKAAVLVSGGAPSLDATVDKAPENLRNALRPILSATDPTRFIGLSKAALLLQAGKEDTYVPQEDLKALAKAAGSRSEFKEYEGGHDLFSAQPAVHDALAFLSTKLGSGPRIKGAQVGP